MNIDKMSHNTMDKKTKLIVAKSLKDMIMSADLVQLDMYQDYVEAWDQNGGHEVRYAPTGRVSVTLELVRKKSDGRAELYRNCSKEIVE